MKLLLSPRFWIAAVLAAMLALSSFTAYRLGKATVRAAWDADKLAMRAAVDAANVNAQAAAELYEEAKAKQAVRVVTVTKEIEREVASDPDCSGRAIPAGLRDALTSAAADADPAIPHDTMPAVSGAGIGDVGRSGEGLRIGPRLGP